MTDLRPLETSLNAFAAFAAGMAEGLAPHSELYARVARDAFHTAVKAVALLNDGQTEAARAILHVTRVDIEPLSGFKPMGQLLKALPTMDDAS